MENIGYLLIALAGLLSIAGGVNDWEWFIMNRRARLFVTLLGRFGARVFYVILGIGLFLLGCLLAFGII